MKTYALVFLVFLCAFSKMSMAQKLVFSYDASGNQIERRWVCINCPSSSSMAMAKSTLNGSDQPPLGSESLTGRTIKVAPNPLTETLNVIWGVPEKVFLEKIEVFGITGNRVYSGKYSQGDRTTQISFLNLPPGTYLLKGLYSDSKSEIIKVIKM